MSREDETLDSSSNTGSISAAMPEFAPRSSSGRPYRRGPHQYNGSHGHEQEEQDQEVGPDAESSQTAGKEAKDGLPDDVVLKITKQVEFYFSDVNLATTEQLMRYISKDPEGFVPIAVVASFKKIRELAHDKFSLAAALRTSSELIVSDDCKRVRHQQPCTEADMEKVQLRIVVAENLPEDHRYQNLMKIFSAVGSVKTIRTCYPQPPDSNSATVNRSRIETLFANKVHAFVEYENVEDAEKAVAELSDGRNWRNGLRVRVLLHCLKQGNGQGRKVGDESEDAGDKDDHHIIMHQPRENESEDPSQSSEVHFEHQADENDKEGGMKRGKGRGRGCRDRGRGQHNNNRGRGHAIGTPPSSHAMQNVQAAVKQQPPGPRMPDGTRGFTMGRGKLPLTVTNAH